MRAVDAFDSTIKRARALVKAHHKLHGAGPGKRPRFHSELLRAALVTAVSALDAYFHDKIIENVRKTIRRTSPDFPDHLVQLIAEGNKADNVVKDFLQIAMKDRPLARVATIVSRKLNEKTFQDPGKIAWGMQLIGIGNFWPRVANEMNMTEPEVKSLLMKYIKRRHAIVHRGDLGTSKKTKHRVRKVSGEFAENCIDDVSRFVHSVEAAFAAEA